jgi:hypothetical protein
MPIVPTVNAPQVAPQPLPNVRESAPYHLDTHATQPGRELSTLGQGMLRFGDDSLEEAARQQENLNSAAAKEYDTKLMGAIQGVLYGTPNAPDTGYLSFKGKSAVDAYDATVGKLSGVGADLAKDLQNPAQQQLVKETTNARVQAATVQAAQHREQQAFVYQKTASDVRVKTAQEAAPLAFSPLTDSALAKFDVTDPSANSQYQQYLYTIKTETLDQAERAGLPADVQADMVKANMAKAYTLTLAHLIDRKGGTPGDLAVAKKVFEDVKSELGAETQDKVRALLEAGTKKDTALKLALEVKGSIAGIDAQEKELDKRFKDEKIDSEVHAMALQHLRADNSQRRAEQGEQDKAVVGAVWDLARKGGSMTDLSPGQLAYIKQRGLGPHIDLMFKRADDATFDDSKQFSDLMRMSAEDPAAFVKMDLSTMVGQVTKPHWNHLIGMQTAINRGDLKALDSQKLVQDTIKATKAQMLAAGINLSPKPNTDAAKQLDQFTASVYDSLTTAQIDWEEKKLTRPQMREEARKLTLGMLKDQALAGTGYFGTSVGQSHMPVWKMNAEQKAAPWDIPQAEREQITQALTKRGLPVTEDAVQRAYKLAQGVR